MKVVFFINYIAQIRFVHYHVVSIRPLFTLTTQVEVAAKLLNHFIEKKVTKYSYYLSSQAGKN